MIVLAFEYKFGSREGQVVNHWCEKDILMSFQPLIQTIKKKKKDRIMVSVGTHWRVGIWWAFLNAITLKQIEFDSFPSTDRKHRNISSQIFFETVCYLITCVHISMS